MNRSLVFITVLIVVIIKPAFSISFNDGASHTLNSFHETLFLDDEIANHPGTQVELGWGGWAQYCEIFNNSNLIISGGKIDGDDGLRVFDHASVSMSLGLISKELILNNYAGGTLSAGRIVGEVDVRDKAHFILSGGVIETDVYVRDNASVYMSGGLILDEFQLYDQAGCIITGGKINVDLQANYNSSIIMSGGVVENELSAVHNASITLSGGTLNGSLSITYDATCTVSGGELNGAIGVNRNGIVYLVGSDFTLNGVPLANGDKLSEIAPVVENPPYSDYLGGTITGLLADRSLLNTQVRIRNEGEFAGTCDIIIIEDDNYGPDTLYLDDGLVHIIDPNSPHYNKTVILDYNVDNDPGTHVDLFRTKIWDAELFNHSSMTIRGQVAGDIGLMLFEDSSVTFNSGWIESYVILYQDSSFVMYEGEIEYGIDADDRSSVTLHGGEMRYLRARGNSSVSLSRIGIGSGGIKLEDYASCAMTGGGTAGNLELDDHAVCTRSGGRVSDDLIVRRDGSLYLVGTNFTVNGTPLADGDTLSDVATFVENGDQDYLTGTVTGTLHDGTLLENTFRIYNTGDFAGSADITVTAAWIGDGICDSPFNACIDDGASHIIDQASPYNSKSIFLDFNTPNDPGTHVDLVAGGDIPACYLYHNAGINLGEDAGKMNYLRAGHNALVNMSGGHIIDVVVAGNATFNLTGGRVDGHGDMHAYDQAAVHVSGGSINESLSLRDNTRGRITGGDLLDGLSLSGNAYCVVTGGTFEGDLEMWGSAHCDVFDGLFKGCEIGLNASLSISGGRFITDIERNNFELWNDSTCTMSGGQIEGEGTIVVGNNAALRLVGHQFAVDGVALKNGDKLTDFATYVSIGDQGYYAGILTGILEDGTPIQQKFRIRNDGLFTGTADIFIVSCEYILAGDLDGDCKVNLADLSIIAANWLTDCNTEPANPNCIEKVY